MHVTVNATFILSSSDGAGGKARRSFQWCKGGPLNGKHPFALLAFDIVARLAEFHVETGALTTEQVRAETERLTEYLAAAKIEVEPEPKTRKDP